MMNQDSYHYAQYYNMYPTNSDYPYYPFTYPGPPIQPTHRFKGPDGANLFVFHIPDFFITLDLWNLFSQYGKLLSARIVAEESTGRSRGFGFVSFESPVSAAIAIHALNFAVVRVTFYIH